MFCMSGGSFAFRWLSYSVAGRGVVKCCGFAKVRQTSPRFAKVRTKARTYFSGAKKAHKLFSHKLSVPPFVPGIVPGTNRVCPRDKPGEIGLPLCRIRRKPRFVPRPTGQKSLCLCAFFLPELLVHPGTCLKLKNEHRQKLP